MAFGMFAAALVFAPTKQVAANSESSAGWIRTNDDCVYTVSGKVGADAYLFGVYIGRIGADGTATYTAKDAQTDCASGGNQQCEARYCPINPF